LHKDQSRENKKCYTFFDFSCMIHTFETCESCNFLPELCNTCAFKGLQLCGVIIGSTKNYGMETKMKLFAIALILIIGTCIAPVKTSAQGGYVSFQVFYDELTPYGTWVENPDYGYVWLPDVAPGFTPYATNGYWVNTEDGWTWVSNYSWGWAPFHYGRWYSDPYYGPMWVPDNEWGPGWVTWRSSGGYYGWAPIAPGISISIAYSNSYNVPYSQWTFVRDRDFGRTNINNYYISSSNNITIINNSTVINNTRVDRSRNVTYNAGPERAEVEKRVGKRFAPVAIRESSKPGQRLENNQLQIYRPQVQRSGNNGQKPAPSRVTNLKDVKPPAQRTPATPRQKANPQENHQAIPPQRTEQQPKKQQPQQQQQQKQQPQRQQPQKQQPQKQQPQRQQPQKQQPQQQQPQRQQIQKQQPQQQQPQRQQIQKQQPQQQQPQKQQPQRQQPQKQQPQKQQPQKQQPDKQPQDKGGEKPPHASVHSS
jgi:hypothetical protein